MNHVPKSRRLLLALCLLLAAPTAWAPSASAQNRETDLARENDRLRGQVSDLEAALDAAMKKIATLEKQVADLRKSPNGSSIQPAASVVDTPEASPAGMIDRIRSAITEARASGEILPTADERDPKAQSRHLRSLQKWIASANRTFKQRISWPVLVGSMEQTGPTSARVQLTPWNPETDASCGDPFTVMVSPRILENVRRSRIRATGNRPIFLLAGVFEPRISYNSERLEVGPFDNPRFIAPTVEMRWGVEFKSLGDLKTDATEEMDAKPAPGRENG